MLNDVKWMLKFNIHLTTILLVDTHTILFGGVPYHHESNLILLSFDLVISMC